LIRALQGKKVQVTHGLGDSLAQIEALPEEARAAFTERYIKFVDGLISHLWLDGGGLVVAHAGMKEEMIGRASGKVRDFALYGETTGETDEFGLPIRWDWASEYRGRTSVVYGHTPVPAPPQWLNNTLDIDTGCVFGGSLTALRWPEKETVEVAARQVYAERVSVPVNAPSPPPPTSWVPALSRKREEGESGYSPASATPEGNGGAIVSLQWKQDDLLDIADYIGRRVVNTRLGGNVVIAEGNSAAALEVMSRYAAHPRWLMYLPPTMSPVETSKAEGYLERPEEAFAYFAGRGVETVVCQEKHMGSRAVLVVCRTQEAARERFGATQGEQGAILTRTGRPFFTEDSHTADTILEETAQAMETSGLWDELATNWCCLDAEIMPWNAKAQGLLREQYAPVGAAGRAALAAELSVAELALGRDLAGVETLVDRLRGRLNDIEAYRTAYGQYCWKVNAMADLKIAPFHLLAVEGRTLLNKDHEWHLAMLARLAAVSPLFHATDNLRVELADSTSVAQGISWWELKTGAGGEGMVVKPLAFLPEKRCQPAVKVRGREYLRIIYGPEYTDPENLTRLRSRGLGSKRALASKEFLLGVEGLERFVAKEPLRRVHECAIGVLALESEPVDPRL
jgi:protein phosphatase